MRSFFARRIADARSGLQPSGDGFSPAILIALAVVTFLGVSFGPSISAARADDGGMMSFLLHEAPRPAARAPSRPFFFAAPSFARHASVERRRSRAHAAFARKSKAHRAARFARHERRHAASKLVVASLVSATEAAPVQQLVVSPSELARKAEAAAKRPSDVYLSDRTLRRGDVVATADGLRVFLGAKHFPLQPKDFASLARARHVVDRAMLLALDQAIAGRRRVAVASAEPTAGMHRLRRGRHPAARFVKRVQNAQVAHAGKTADATATVALAYAPRPSFGPADKAIEKAIRRIDIPAQNRNFRAERPDPRPASARATPTKGPGFVTE